MSKNNQTFSKCHGWNTRVAGLLLPPVAQLNWRVRVKGVDRLWKCFVLCFVCVCLVFGQSQTVHLSCWKVLNCLSCQLTHCCMEELRCCIVAVWNCLWNWNVELFLLLLSVVVFRCGINELLLCWMEVVCRSRSWFCCVVGIVDILLVFLCQLLEFGMFGCCWNCECVELVVLELWMRKFVEYCLLIVELFVSFVELFTSVVESFTSVVECWIVDWVYLW